MKGDVMQAAGLEIYAELGLVLFIAGFLLALIRVWIMKREEADRHARIPLEDDILDASEVEA